MVEVTEEVLATVFFRPRKIRGCKSPADDAGRRIVVYGTVKTRVGFRTMLDDRPAVVGAGDAFVDLFRDPADVIDENTASFRLDREREWIATSQCPDSPILSRSRLDEGVVVGDGAVRIDA